MLRPLYRSGLAVCVLLLVSVVANAQSYEVVEPTLPPVPFVAKAAPGLGAPIVAAERPFADSARETPATDKAADLNDANAKSVYLVDLAISSMDHVDPAQIIDSQQNNLPTYRERMHNIYCEQVELLLQSDLRNLYWSENTLYLGLGIALAAPLANTHADQGFRDWYQRQAGGGRANDTALFLRHFGEWKYVVPAEFAISLAGHAFPYEVLGQWAGDFGDRSLRALAVGAPMVGLLEVGLGSYGPDAGSSRWHPFKSNHGASDIAFVGAIPFLTAAEMTDYKALQAALVVASFATSWSRVQTDDHYLSQVLLGWTCAYLAVRSVNQTEADRSRNMQVVPMPMGNGAGVAVVMKY